MNNRPHSASTRPLRILVSAYSCETGRGSEGEIGWRIVNNLARNNEVWVITRANLRSIHEEAFKTEPRPDGLHFVYFDLPWIFRFYKRGRRFFLVYYYLWQIGVGLKARRLVQALDFDLLHHMIGGMDWMPAGIALAPGPFLWGPVGSENTHPLVFAGLPLLSRVKERFRQVVRWGLRTFDPLQHLTGWRASMILSHTPENLPRRYQQRIRPFPQTGISNRKTLVRCKTSYARAERLQIIFAGELKDWKGAWFACAGTLKFFETDTQSDLIIVGDGPLRAKLQGMVQRHPQGHRVRFLGQISMEELVSVLETGDVFLYPSFHHGMSTVVLQAMLTGLPVICLEGDAHGRAIGQDAGITVALEPNRSPADGIAHALTALAQDDVQRQKLARAAQAIARERFAYESLASAMTEHYRDVASAGYGHLPAQLGRLTTTK